MVTSNAKNASLLKRERLQKLIEGKRHNKEEIGRFFTALYANENDPFAPGNLETDFPGIDIPDIRKPGSTLEDLWPHLFIVKTDPSDPDFAAYQPKSPEYQEELKSVVTLIRKIRQVADQVNEETNRKLCEQQSQARS